MRMVVEVGGAAGGAARFDAFDRRVDARLR